MGPAGSGKTALTSALGKWIEEFQGLSVSYINLDPGAEFIPYKPCFDIRKIFTIRDIMIKDNLGPNGAMIKASELMAQIAPKIVSELRSLNTDVLLVDTPGQSEIFIFRPSGPKIISHMKNLAPTVGLYLVDSTLSPFASEAVISILMGLVDQLRLDIPVLPVMSKADLIKEKSSYSLTLELNKVKDLAQTELKGVISEFIAELVDVFIDYLPPIRIVRVSSKTMEGMEDLYSLIHETFCTCGDLT